VGASLPWGLSREAQQEAVEEIREAVDALPRGAPRAELEKARDGIVERYKRVHEREEKKQRLVEDALHEIYPYLLKLDRKWEFDKSAWGLGQDLTPAIREALAEELQGDVRRLVREVLRL